MDDDDVKISYSAKELLEGIDKKLDNVIDRVFVLEQDKVAKAKRRSYLRDAVILAGTVVMATGSAVGIVAAVHGL
jgi:hypothetical protein